LLIVLPSSIKFLPRLGCELETAEACRLASTSGFLDGHAFGSVVGFLRTDFADDLTIDVDTSGACD
jgi:hypothetical protein